MKPSFTWRSIGPLYKGLKNPDRAVVRDMLDLLELGPVIQNKMMPNLNSSSIWTGHSSFRIRS